MSKSIRLVPSEIEFPVQDGQTILEAALLNDVNLEYGCSNGQCGQCKAELIEGIIGIKSQTIYTNNLLPGEILTCCTVPQSNLLLNANFHPELSSIERKTVSVKVDEITFPADDILVMKLRIPPNVNFIFLPGQYIDLNWNNYSRSYSIASSNAQENNIELHIKKVEDGLFSNFFFNNLRINQLFHFHGPLGTFFLRESSDPLIFLCTGTGFAPIKSIIESLIDSDSPRQIYLYWGCKTSEDLYSDLPGYWSKKFNNINFVPVLSRATELPSMAISGYVQQVVISQHKNLQRFEVYACGSKQMIRDSKQLLVENGLRIENFYSDAFVSSD